jgi:tetratricopeptide (TPR) repeat protein
LTQREEMRIRALYAMDTGDWQAAENLFRTFALYFPNDYYPRFYHALALEWSGRTQEAVEEFREAGRLQPSLYHMPAHLAMSLFTLGRFDQASREIARVRAFGREFWARFLEGVADFLQGNWAAAEQRFESLTQCPDANWRSRGRALRACLLAELGRCEEALRILDEGLASDAKDGQIMAQADKLLAVAWIRSQRNERAACRAACLKAVELESGPSRLCRAGAVLARSGFPEEAEKLLPSLKPDLHLSAFRGAAHRILGEVLLARGQVAEALAEFRQAGALEYPARHREWLARALEASGDRAAACQLFQKAAASAALIWQAPEEELPGLWAECLFQYARLARVLGRDQEFGRAMKQYVALTTHADAGIGHAAEARAMLAAAGQNPDTR